MLDLKSFSKISTQVYAAGLDQSNWADVLEAITKIFPSVRTHLFSQDTLNNYSNLAFVNGYDPHFLDTYGQHYAGLNPWAPTFATKGTGSVLPSFEMCSDENLKRTEFYADWLLPQEKIIGGGGGVVGRTPTASALFGGNIRASEREALEPKWMEFVDLIMPVMVQAWRVNRAIAASALDRQLPEHARRSETAVLLLRSDGCPIYVNETAQDQIDREDGLQQDHLGRVWVCGSPMANQFIRRGKWHRENATFDTRLQNGRQVWIAELDPAATNSVDLLLTFGMDAPGILLVISRERKKSDPKAQLMLRFKLTPAEANVMMALSDGLSSVEIAQLRGVSPNTVRHQVKQCAVKCSVRRQSELAVIAARTKLRS